MLISSSRSIKYFLQARKHTIQYGYTQFNELIWWEFKFPDETNAKFIYSFSSVEKVLTPGFVLCLPRVCSGKLVYGLLSCCEYLNTSWGSLSTKGFLWDLSIIVILCKCCYTTWCIKYKLWRQNVDNIYYAC